MTYNAISHEIRDQQPEITPHYEASKMEAPAENNMTGVASYVEKAAEEDIKAKLMMEISDLKQLLGGRKAQVDSLSAEKVHLQQKLNQLQELEHTCSNHKHRHLGPGSVSFSLPVPIPTQINGKGDQDQTDMKVKVVKEMQLDALKSEAMARGMDTAAVISMTKDTLLKKLVIGTTCISKSTVWSKVVSLRRSIENEKAAICAQDDEKQLQLDTKETKCAPMRNKCPRKKRARNVKFKFNINMPPNANGVSVLNENTNSTQDIPRVSYPSLADKDDDKNTHPSHAIIRRDILEAFVPVAPKFKDDEGGILIRSKRKLSRQQRYTGFVGFRCRYCKDKPINKRAGLAAIFPETISGIYRANIRFQSKHIEACPYIPKQLKAQLNCLKTSKNTSRGKRTYWTKSALQKGFCDWQSPAGAGRNGIIYCPERT